MARNIDQKLLEQLVEDFLENWKVHSYVLMGIAQEWDTEIKGQMTQEQQEEFTCQQQRLWYKDILLTMALGM